ncbi:MDR family MFS transporter [Nocardia sp. NPDC024068]|uniref:MDR family MFS transporter n=1 Tax=Nocardia sp. NPDC024068 TaxID=3157197 RepID=UPI0033D03A1F
MTTRRGTVDGAEQMSRSRTNLVFVTILLGMLMAALDQTIVSTALPTIVADLGGAGHMAWVVTAYMLAEAIATILVGKFGDLFGRKVVFQSSAVVFVVASAAAGLSQGMVELIVARAAQGLGGGGLMVTAMALIADTIPLKERGKYQGALGAVFGVTTVLGPTLGGLFTDHADWRWCFYVNIPIAVLMIAMAAKTIPVVRSHIRPIIDYTGIALVALGVSALILALEWGGQEYAWNSAMILGLFAASVVLLAGFVVAERRAPEPVLPMGLFRGNVFTVCSILSFIVGFAMLGSMTYLPAYLQYVDGVSATVSGLRTLPMVVGLLVTSVLSGSVVGRTGRYKAFPIAGAAVMAAGLFLMSTMNQHTGIWLESLYMLVLGLGIGLAMQVLTIVVQNTVPYEQLGTATSGVTFFRTLGSAFGTAIFGTLYSNSLTPGLAAAVAETGVPAEAAQNPAALRALPGPQAEPIIDAYAAAINSVFLWVVPVALAGFVVAWFLKEVPLRDSARAGAADLGEGFGVPDSSDNLAQLERAISNVLRRERARTDAVPGREVLEESGSPLAPDVAWALVEVHVRTRVAGAPTLAEMAWDHRLPPAVLAPLFGRAQDAGYLAAVDGRLRLTGSGGVEVRRLEAKWRQWLDGRLEDWTFADPRDRVLLDLALDNIATKLLDRQDGPLTPSAR